MKALLKSLFWSSRPISWVNTAYPFAAGALVAGSLPTITLVIGTLFFLIPYNFTMYGINDVFDYESDIRNPRKGGVEGAIVAPKYHKATIYSSLLLSLPFVIFLLSQGPVWSRIWLIYLLFMVLAYSAPVLRFKERPVLDSFTSSSHFIGPLVYALLLVGFRSAFWPAILAFGAWGMASHALGAVQDVKADREGGIASIATAFGARLTTRLVVVLYLLAGLLLVKYGILGTVVALTVLPYAHNAARFWYITDAKCEQVNAAWKRFLWLNWLSGAVITMVLIYSRLQH